MKRRSKQMKKLLIISIIIVMAYSSIVNAQSSLEGGFLNMQNIKKSISIENVSQIEAKFTIGRITIYESNNEMIEITGSISGNSSKGIELKKLGDTIYIKQKVGYFPIKVGITRIFIGIPVNYSNDLTIKQLTGKLTIKNIDIDTLNINTSAATTLVDDILFENFNLKAGSASSNINLKRKSGNIFVNSTIGRVNINIKEISGDINFEGGTMGGKLVIPKNAQVEIINIGNKNCKINAHTSKKKNHRIIIKAGVGKIKVTDKEKINY